MPKVSPAILVWARETAGLNRTAATEAIGLKAARGMSGADRLAALEAGEGDITRPLLARMAKRYRRPLLVFYLSQPPARGDRGQDFRKLPGDAAPDFDPELDALIRDVRVRHGLIKTLLQDDDAGALPFVGALNEHSRAQDIAAAIVATISFDLAKFRAARDVGEAFTYLRSRLEAAGIFVLLIGNLGSYHTNIGARTFRGFAIADDIAPMIVINDQDANAAWSFTALHEAAHLWIGTTGISGASAEARIEKLCNDVAGIILLPAGELGDLRPALAAGDERALRDLSAFATDRNISRAMVSYQLLRTGLIDQVRWRAFDDHFYGEWEAAKARKADKRGGQAGPTFPVLRRHRLGPALVGLVARSLDEGALTYTKAGQLLGVKPRTVEAVLRTATAGGA